MRRAPGRWAAWGARLALALLLGAAPLVAQPPSVEVRPPSSAEATDGPVVRLARLLDTAAVGGLLRNGFPVRLHVRLELWSLGRWFNDLDDQVEWDVVVRFDPLERGYSVTRLAGGRATRLGDFSRLADAAEATAIPFRPPVAPPRRGRRSYYAAQVDVEALSFSDLDEVQRWLRGDLSPAGAAPRGGDGPVGRGVRALVTRVLGGEARRYEARTPAVRY
jgi:hypothetical protein